jgi:hypothetical protein
MEGWYKHVMPAACPTQGYTLPDTKTQNKTAENTHQEKNSVSDLGVHLVDGGQEAGLVAGVEAEDGVAPPDVHRPEEQPEVLVQDLTLHHPLVPPVCAAHSSLRVSNMIVIAIMIMTIVIIIIIIIVMSLTAPGITQPPWSRGLGLIVSER